MTAVEVNAAQLKEVLLEIATDCVSQGPGFAQEPVVIREAVEKLDISHDLVAQQELLTAWHDLFREGVLSWGYDANNSAAPFYHFARRS